MHIQSEMLELLELDDAELQDINVTREGDENNRGVLVRCVMM